MKLSHLCFYKISLLTCFAVTVAIATNMKLAKVNDIERYELNAVLRDDVRN